MSQGGTQGVVLGVDLGGTKMALATAGAAGTILNSALLPTEAARGAEQALRRSLDRAAEIVAEQARAGQPVRAVGLSTMGITEADGVRLAPTVEGWERLRIPERVAEALPGLPVRIDNDLRAATIAELRWGALHGIGTGIYVNLGTGVGAGLVAGGRLLSGAHGAAGEIAYLQRDAAAAAAARPGAAPFEEAVSGKTVARRTSAALGRPLSMAELVAAAADGDAAARALLDDVLGEICFQVTNLAVAFDPEVVVIGGGYARAAGTLLDRLRDAAARRVPFPPCVVASRFGPDAALRGAIALALEVTPEASQATGTDLPPPTPPPGLPK